MRPMTPTSQNSRPRPPSQSMSSGTRNWSRTSAPAVPRPVNNSNQWAKVTPWKRGCMIRACNPKAMTFPPENANRSRELPRTRGNEPMLSRTGSILVPFFVTWLLGCSLLEPEPLLLIDGRGYDPRPPEALAETTPEVMDAWVGQSIDFHLLYHQAQRVLPDLYRRYLVQALLEAETASVRLTNQEVMNYLHPRYGRKVAE